MASSSHLHLSHQKSPASVVSSNKSFLKIKKNSIIISYGRTSRSRRTSCYGFHVESCLVSSSTGIDIDTETVSSDKGRNRKPRILVAGGGVGGLVLALAAKTRGFEVVVFEKDLSTVRGEGRHRGPIQLLSSALAVLEGINKDVAKQIMDAGCVTGNRINGLADGLSGNWFAKFDLLTPAVERGLPVTLVISRITLQHILLNAVGDNIVNNKSKVVDFSQDSHKVTVTLDNGQHYEGDILVGADGIWSEVRKKLFGAQEASYSGYTCYSGLADYVPPYIDSIGYRVFLGPNKYFVASDVGKGKMQWYAFHREPPRNTDPPKGKKRRLMELFASWCGDVTTLISQTQEEMILRRDIYDRDMIYSWGIGRVTLLGDAAHPMQPNLGQGGCMAIEDCYQLILELEDVDKSGSDAFKLDDIASALKRYEQKRMLRTNIVHGVTRTASVLMNSYQPFMYLGTVKLPHISVQLSGIILQLVLPHFMTWLLTGHGFVVKDRNQRWTKAGNWL